MDCPEDREYFRPLRHVTETGKRFFRIQEAEMTLPKIVYFQTLTACNGHCVYCPFDDIYDSDWIETMELETYTRAINWLARFKYTGRIGFLLHCEPTLDIGLSQLIQVARSWLPNCLIEIATNGIEDRYNILRLADSVQITPPNSLMRPTSRAGNVKACEGLTRDPISSKPCTLPRDTMCIAHNGAVLLCCQDWRHESIVGTVDDLTAARERQLSIDTNIQEICNDCMNGRTLEEVRIGQRRLI